MKRFFLWFLVCVIFPVSVCTIAASACTKQQATNVENTLPALAQCVIEAAGADFIEALQDPASLILAVASACEKYGVITGAQILAIIESWFTSQPTLDGGSVVSAQRMGRIRKVHAAARATMHIVIVSPPEASTQ